MSIRRLAWIKGGQFAGEAHLTVMEQGGGYMTLCGAEFLMKPVPAEAETVRCEKCDALDRSGKAITIRAPGNGKKVRSRSPETTTSTSGTTSSNAGGGKGPPPFSVKIRGLRWSLEARLLAAVVHKYHKDYLEITAEEMEAVEGAMVDERPRGSKTFVVITEKADGAK